MEAIKPSRIRIDVHLRKDRVLLATRGFRIRLQGVIAISIKWDKPERVVPFNSIMFVFLLLR